MVSRSGAQHQAITVDDSSEIEPAVADADIVAVEEGQFFDERLPEVVERLAELGKQVVVTGLDRDFRGIPFGPMPRLLALADQVTKLTAICMCVASRRHGRSGLSTAWPAPARLAADRDRRDGRRNLRGALPAPPRGPRHRRMT